MDSAGNSGSMQSSSGGGDEEYESRSESISSFLNPSPHNFGSISDHHPQIFPHQPTNPAALFNIPHSHNNLGHVFPQSLLPNNNHPGGGNGNTNPPSTQYGTSNHDLIWSRGLRSESNYANFGNATSSGPDGVNQGINNINQSPSIPASTNAAAAAAKAATAAGLIQQSGDQQQQPGNVVKNPKKRTRASRRAPTTVLTTDTTNFRQMVQEFTGIPTAPFSSAAASPFSSRRLDLFSSSSMRGHLADSLGSSLYPLRPSAQKMVQLSPFGNSSNTLNIGALVSSTSTDAASNSSTVLASEHQLGLPKQPHDQNLLNMQNQMLSFQPLLLNKHDHQPSNSFDELGLNVNANQQLSGWKDGGGTLNAGEENLGGSSQHISNYKGLENVTSAGTEGTMQGSWICPSD